MKYAKKVFKRAAKTAIKKGKKFLRKRYVTKTGKGLRVGQIVKDVAMLKKMVNAEKKRYFFTVTNQAVAQVDGNSTGSYVRDITPVPSEGVTFNTRNGASIKWTSSYISLQLIHQTATQSAIRGKIMFVKVKNQVINNTTFISNFLKQNQFTTSGVVYDVTSERNQDYYKDFIVLRTKNFYIACDQLSGQTVSKTYRIPLKFGHHVKFSGDTTTVTDGQVFMLILCDSGNMNASTISTVGNIPVTAVSTGLNLCYSVSNYFIDN